jgi:hypothetical protein
MTFDIPDACTLPTAERPLRLAEFDDVITTAVRGVDRLDATHARLRLSGPPGLAATVRDLTARETECCSFFDFTVTSDGADVVLDIAVPPRYADVLASLVSSATRIDHGRTEE